MIKNTLIFVTICALFSGCATIAPKTTEQMVKAVQRYCVLPQADRLFVRSQVNASLDVNNASVCIDCPGTGDECATAAKTKVDN